MAGGFYEGVATEVAGPGRRGDMKIDHDTKGDLLQFTSLRCVRLPHHPNHLETCKQVYVSYPHRQSYFHGDTQRGAIPCRDTQATKAPNPLSASSSSTAEPSTCQASKQASQSVISALKQPAQPVCPGKGKRESSRSKPNPIHPEGRKKQKKKTPNSMHHQDPPPSDWPARLLRLSLSLVHLPCRSPSSLPLSAEVGRESSQAMTVLSTLPPGSNHRFCLSAVLDIEEEESGLASDACEEDAIRSPVLVDLKGPVELQVGLLVVVDEAGADRVVAADGPARGGGLLGDCVGKRV